MYCTDIIVFNNNKIISIDNNCKTYFSVCVALDEKLGKIWFGLIKRSLTLEVNKHSNFKVFTVSAKKIKYA